MAACLCREGSGGSGWSQQGNPLICYQCMPRGGQHEGIVFNIPNLIQSFPFEDKECDAHKNHVSYHDSY